MVVVAVAVVVVIPLFAPLVPISSSISPGFLVLLGRLSSVVAMMSSSECNMQYCMLLDMPSSSYSNNSDANTVTTRVSPHFHSYLLNKDEQSNLCAAFTNISCRHKRSARTFHCHEPSAMIMNSYYRK